MGPAGLAAVLLYDGGLFELHGLVEPVFDPSRIFSERYRLTELGARYAPIYLPKGMT